MRGTAEKQVVMLSALTPDQLVPQDHPIRQIKPIVDRALADLSPTFNAMYAEGAAPLSPRSTCSRDASSSPCIPSGASASSASGCNTTCCSNGFST
jgi:hypothetical protein